MSLKNLIFPPPGMSFSMSFPIKGLGAGEYVEYSVEKELRHFRKWMPFYTFQIHNNSSASLSIHFDYRPSSILRVAPQNQAARRNLPFESFIIKNESTAVVSASDEVLVIIERVQ